MGALIFNVLLGAAVGYAASAYMRLRVDRKTAVLAGAIGGLIGAFALKFLLSTIGALLGGVIGAVIVVYLAQALTRR